MTKQNAPAELTDQDLDAVDGAGGWDIVNGIVSTAVGLAGGPAAGTGAGLAIEGIERYHKSRSRAPASPVGASRSSEHGAPVMYRR